MYKVRALEIFEELRGHRIGGWEIVDFVGHGGSAVVFKSVRKGKTAALKIIDQEIVAKFGRVEQIERVKRERQLIGHSHPNLIKIYDAGVCDRTGYLFVAMELHHSATLTELIPTFPSEQIYPAISQIASAAHFLEEKGLVHRDIKPDNIIVSEDFSTVTLLDLGVLRPLTNLDEDITSATAFLGTTRYASPEYLLREGEEETIRGWRALTFYQLGGLIHDMIMQRRLFDDIDAPPPRLTDAVRYSLPHIENTNVPTSLISLAKNCLHKDWKLRLSLVSWNRFDESASNSELQVTEEIIAKRIGSQKQLRQEKPLERKTGSRRLALQRIRTLVSTILAKECIDSELFPPIRISGAEDEPQDATNVVLQTGPSVRHAIAGQLVVKFRTQVLDFGTNLIKIIGIAAIGSIEVEVEDHQLNTVYVGEASEHELCIALRKFTIRALDAAQRESMQTDSNVLLFEWETQSC